MSGLCHAPSRDSAEGRNLYDGGGTEQDVAVLLLWLLVAAFFWLPCGPRSSSSPQGGELSIGIWVKSSVMVGESWVRSALVDKSGAGLPAEYYLGLYRAADDDLAKVEVRIGAGDSLKGTWLDVWEVRLDYARAASPMPASCVAHV